MRHRKRPYHFTHTTDPNNLQTVRDIVMEMRKHEEVLVHSDVHKLIYFSRAYAIMNRSIERACMDGYFEMPHTITRLQVYFARTYIMVLNDFVHTGELPNAWKIVVRGRSSRFHPAILSLLLAIRAHIKHDAPLSLSMLDVQESRHLAKDYAAIDRLFRGASKEIIREYNPRPLFTVPKEMLRRLYILPINALLVRWRKDVWMRFSGS
jgi:hypothetical protein